MIVVHGGKLFHLALDWRGKWAWFSVLPDRDIPWHSRNVPRGWRFWEWIGQ